MIPLSPAASCPLRTIILSPISTSVEFTVVVVPFTVKSPERIRFVNCGESSVPNPLVFTFTPFNFICPCPSPSAELLITPLGNSSVIEPLNVPLGRIASTLPTVTVPSVVILPCVKCSSEE